MLGRTQETAQPIDIGQLVSVTGRPQRAENTPRQEC